MRYEGVAIVAWLLVSATFVYALLLLAGCAAPDERILPVKGLRPPSVYRLPSAAPVVVAVTP